MNQPALDLTTPIGNLHTGATMKCPNPGTDVAPGDSVATPPLPAAGARLVDRHVRTGTVAEVRPSLAKYGITDEDMEDNDD